MSNFPIWFNIYTLGVILTPLLFNTYEYLFNHTESWRSCTFFDSSSHLVTKEKAQLASLSQNTEEKNQ